MQQRQAFNHSFSQDWWIVGSDHFVLVRLSQRLPASQHGPRPLEATPATRFATMLACTGVFKKNLCSFLTYCRFYSLQAKEIASVIPAIAKRLQNCLAVAYSSKVILLGPAGKFWVCDGLVMLCVRSSPQQENLTYSICITARHENPRAFCWRLLSNLRLAIDAPQRA